MTIQRWLGSKIASGFLTIIVMFMFMFLLGFIADPIINLYVDPYDTIVGNEPAWSEVDVATSNGSISGWGLHFIKGLISMGLVGFLKTALLNPFNFFNLRNSGFVSYRRASTTTTTGRDRAVNVSWIAVAIGIASAFYFFYKWVQKIIGHTLTRIGNNIVDTSLPGDDEDLKPPPDWKPKPTGSKAAESAFQEADRLSDPVPSSSSHAKPERSTSGSSENVDTAATPIHTPVEAPSATSGGPVMHEEPLLATTVTDRDARTSIDTGVTTALDDAREQGWSFVGIPRQR